MRLPAIWYSGRALNDSRYESGTIIIIYDAVQALDLILREDLRVSISVAEDNKHYHVQN